MRSANSTERFQYIRSYEICPLRWFLVRTTQMPGLAPGASRYFMLHMSDLIDGNFIDIHANRLVNFKLNHHIISGYVLEASNRMLCLVDRIQQLAGESMSIYESMALLLQRLNHSLHEINAMVASLKRVTNLTSNMQQKHYFKQLMEQLMHDGDELMETKAFFNSLNLICCKSKALIEHNKFLPISDIRAHLQHYLDEIAAVVGDVQRYQRVFHSPQCICNVHQLPGELEALVDKLIEQEPEVVDR